MKNIFIFVYYYCLGINITQLILELFTENRLFLLIFNKFEKVTLTLESTTDESIIVNHCCNIIHDLYADVFEEFYMLWIVRNPKDIMAFSVVFDELKVLVRKKYLPMFKL